MVSDTAAITSIIFHHRCRRFCCSTLARERSRRTSERSYLTQDERSSIDEKISFAEWRSLLRVLTTWGMVFGNFGNGYMTWLYVTWLPQYLESQRHISVYQVGWIASIPYILAVIASVSTGFAIDRLLVLGFSPMASRKLPIIIGMFGAAACTICAAIISSNAIAIVAISGAVFMGGMASSGIWGLAVVVAPAKSTASLGSMQNFGGFIGAALAPMLTGFIVEATKSFVPALLLSAGIAVVSASIYLLAVRRPIE
jgi:cyanate permease